MPFRSKRQQRFLFAKHPQIAQRFARHTRSFRRLPERRRKKKK